MSLAPKPIEKLTASDRPYAGRTLEPKLDIVTNVSSFKGADAQTIWAGGCAGLEKFYPI